MKNKFIVIEGCDFTGKSSVIENLGKSLESGGIKFKLTKALGGTECGEKCRDYVMENSGKVSNSVILDKMIDENILSIMSVIFVMLMVVVVMAAIFSLGKIGVNNKYFWPLGSFASFLGVAALVSVLIK